jgi:hypothetical protein
MKNLKKKVLVGVILVSFSSLMHAGSREYSSSDQYSLSSTWSSLSVPAGATVRSLTTATVGTVSNPAWTWAGTIPGSPSVTGWVRVNGVYAVLFHLPAIPELPYYNQNQSNPYASSAVAVAGIAGPPAGLIHEARAMIMGVDSFSYDEKWSYNLAGGDYYIYHGGGVSGCGSVTAYTAISW